MELANIISALIADRWSPRNVSSYLSLTIHDVTKDYKMCHYILNLYHLRESHTEENIGNTLLSFVSTWKLHEVN